MIPKHNAQPNPVSSHSEVSNEGVATSASKQISSLKHMTRKLATT
jgi:hypothetical protein